jgi:glutamine synthetase
MLIVMANSFKILYLSTLKSLEMAILRFVALEKALSRIPKEFNIPFKKTSEYFGINVFDDAKMQKYLSREAYESIKESIWTGSRIDYKIADQIATGMKAWASEMGATHYTHWFHPLNDGTAEKHDAFIELGDNGAIIESFSGKELVQQEPDASSFPSGGLRNTFEARGYTAWDPSSPAFIVGKTLSIPTIFVSYTGESLDHKTPLLKALSALDKAAVDVCQYFDKNVTKVFSNLGWEQEYYLIDEALHNARPDLTLTDRTLLGHSSAKDQQLDDNYFGSIPERVSTFMHELEFEAYKLGIPIKTRHNEVAPNQYEVASIFEEANLAVDHNLLLMDLMRRIARHHQFRVIFHEKPFKGLNGSGKHTNWSLSTDTGVILHAPGKNPKTNIQFLTFLVNTVKAVHDHQDLLRASVLTASNALRLGANEAPPTIISIFLGSQITDMLNEIEQKVTSRKMTPDEKTELKLDIGKIPKILLDNTDKNRTSPFAFTGNRFEYRTVGSSANCASPLIVLNTAVAAQLKKFKREVDALVRKEIKKDEAILQVLRKLIIETKAIRFEGNNYDADWVKEALKRGLTNVSDVPEAISSYVSESSKKLFASMKIFTEKELEARTDVRYETYIKKLQIESRVLEDLAINQIVPTAMKYQTDLLNNVKALKDVFDENTYKHLSQARLDVIKGISLNITDIKEKVKEMVEARKLANNLADIKRRADKYSKTVAPYLDGIREIIDSLEKTVDNELWPLPKYRELLFAR